MTHNVTNLGAFNERDGLVKIDVCGDGNFRTGKDGVVGIYATGDRKVEFIDFGTHTLAYVASTTPPPTKPTYPLCRGTRCPSIFNTVLTNTAPTKTCKRRANCTSSTRITK